MSLSNEFEKIETIKEKYSNESLVQEIYMKDYLSNISKTIIDSYNINNTFAELVSYYLSKSDFERFGAAYGEDITIYASDKGDFFTITKNKGINTLEYRNSIGDVSITLKSKKDKAFVERVIMQDDNSSRITKSEFEISNNKYYQKVYSDKLIMKEDNLTTIGTEAFCYDINKNEMTKSYSMVTKNDYKVISKSSISFNMEKDEYVINNGIIHIINNKSNMEVLKRAKRLENKMINKKD